MTRPRMITMCLIASAALIQGLFTVQASDGAKIKVEMTDTQTIPFVSRGEIDFNGSYGEVRVEGWDRPEVVIMITKALRADDTPADRAKKRERLNQVKVAATRQSDKLVISSSVPSPWFHGSVQLTYELKVPRESELRIKFGAGEVSSKNVLGDITITEHAGEISVALPEGEYAIDAKARIGDVSSQFPVKARRPHLVGATAIGTKGVETPSVYLRVGVGEINVTKSSSKTGAPE
jgi:hypothetical protein